MLRGNTLRDITKVNSADHIECVVAQNGSVHFSPERSATVLPMLFLFTSLWHKHSLPSVRLMDNSINVSIVVFSSRLGIILDGLPPPGDVTLVIVIFL